MKKVVFVFSALVGCASVESPKPVAASLPIDLRESTAVESAPVIASPAKREEIESFVRAYLDGDDPKEVAVPAKDFQAETLDVDPELVVGARHVLIMHVDSLRVVPSVTRNRDEARLVAEQVLSKLKHGMSFHDAAATFSDEPGASQRGGDLGRFKLRVMVPEFSNAVGRMRVGELRVVESSFGFHIVERTQ